MSSTAPPRDKLTLRFRDLTIGVRAGRADLDWLAEFLAPQFESVPTPHVDREVILCADAQEHEALRAAGPKRDGETIGCFAFDNQLLELQVWTSSPDQLAIYDEKYDAFYCLTADRRTVTILMRTETESGRIPLMRVVREWTMHRVIHSGGLVLHASAFAVKDEAILIAGPKRSGKTTLLMHALSRSDTAYLANDRVLVDFASDSATAFGIQTIATIRSSTLPFLPAAAERLRASTYRCRRTIAESEARGERIRPRANDKYSLSPAQLCAVLDTPARPAALPRALLLPSLTGEPGGFELVPLAPEEARRRLVQAIFGVGAWSDLPEVFTAPTDDDGPPPDALRLRSRLLNLVPTFECRVGLEAYEDPAALGSVLSALLESRR